MRSEHPLLKTQHHQILYIHVDVMPDLQKFHVKYFGNFEAKAVDHMYLKDICSALEFVDLVIYGYDQYHTNFTKTQIRR